MTPWLSVIGMGDDGVAGLSPAARALLDAAEVVVGGARHLALVEGGAEKREWPSPFAGARDLLESLRGRNVVVLASGDPMWFGIGATLTRWVPAGEMRVLPHPGAFSLAAARLGWPLQDCLFLTIHGRPLEVLHLHLAPGRRLLVLSEDGQSPAAVARLLEKAGYGPSRLVVAEHLGGAAERLREATAETWVGAAADLNTIAVECRAESGARLHAAVPGLPDDVFDHDGQLTKREIRAVTLAALAPLPGQVLWDVGAGCGSVAIEWMRTGGRAVAIEPRPDRCARIAANAAALGVPGLEIIRGAAPDALPYSDPDAIFVGGGVSVPGLLEACWSSLRPGGRLVANAVTAEGEAALIALHARFGGQMVRLAVSRLAPVGGFHTWHPAMPVTQYVGRKGG
ncbi:MAG: precorrin-6y C5,15-methyltransferase (decarboxylating) subunit CbiE [Magnetospirillum sp.]|nr:precorrin-6y C5,15-methyltransferase (decarboxylating) subunit CbiE [Magnetospirillum sp.]